MRKKLTSHTLRFQLETTIFGGWNPAGMMGSLVRFTPSASSSRIPWKSDTAAQPGRKEPPPKKTKKPWIKAADRTTLSRMASFESTTRSNLSSCPVRLFWSIICDLQPWCFITWLMLRHRHMQEQPLTVNSRSYSCVHPLVFLVSSQIGCDMTKGVITR